MRGLLLLVVVLIPRFAVAGEVAGERTVVTHTTDEHTREQVSKHGRMIGGLKRSVKALRESVNSLKRRVGLVEKATEKHDQKIAETGQRVAVVEDHLSQVFALLSDPVALTEHIEASRREAEMIRLLNRPAWDFTRVPVHAKSRSGNAGEGHLGRP